MLMSPLYSKMNISRNPRVKAMKMSTKRMLEGISDVNFVPSFRNTPAIDTCFLYRQMLSKTTSERMPSAMPR